MPCIGIFYVSSLLTSVRQFVADFRVQKECCLVGPASSHILHCVATTSKNQRRDVKTLHKLHTLPEMTMTILLHIEEYLLNNNEQELTHEQRCLD